jgi:hypothetical protein
LLAPAPTSRIPNFPWEGRPVQPPTILSRDAHH